MMDLYIVLHTPYMFTMFIYSRYIVFALRVARCHSFVCLYMCISKNILILHWSVYAWECSTSMLWLWSYSILLCS
jgi:hypothetical protein